MCIYIIYKYIYTYPPLRIRRAFVDSPPPAAPAAPLPWRQGKAPKAPQTGGGSVVVSVQSTW